MNPDGMIELTALCGALLDGTLTPAQQQRLQALLKESAEARRYYVRHAGLSASLHSYAAEMQSDAPRPVVAKPKLLWKVGILAAAAVVLLAAIWHPWMQAPKSTNEAPLVALMSGTQDCVWSGDSVVAGAPLQAGQRLELTKGFAEITFDSGAQVTMEGPASLVVGSAWDASLESGAVKASVPEEAVGFRVVHPSVEVVDLGTEFSMIADAQGAEVLVIKGSVEAAARGNAMPVLLHEKESRRFAREGVSEVVDRERKFARFTRKLKLDRAAVNGDYMHWSFDKNTGTDLIAEAKGRRKGGHTKLAASASTTLTDGKWNKGLSFTGNLYAKANVPGISAPGVARTVAFWVQLPEDASLGTGGASIIAWGQHNRKRGAESARVAWNKSPANGPVGVIRTELGGALVMGSTNVRDGRWHHVAVVMVPDVGGSLQAKQYVDGRLDGMAIKEYAARRDGEFAKRDVGDALWLGHAPSDHAKESCFSGVIDELFVIDQALSPPQIVRLMHDNQPPETMVADAL